MRNPDVDAWFEKKRHPLEEAMQRVRDITLAADPRITETIKWSTPTYSYKGNIFSFNPAKRLACSSTPVHRSREIIRRLRGTPRLPG
jgi:uncharacterized protein YdhG (YjbR/CyaY superfamily)